MNLKRLLRANKLRLIQLLLLVLGISGCDSFFNDRDKEYFDPRDHPVIMAGDTLVFIGAENVDSFYVWESQFYLPHERYGDEDYEQYVGVMTHGTYADTSIRFDININGGRYSLFYYFPRRNVNWDPIGSVVYIDKSNGDHSMQIWNIELDDLHKAIFERDKYNLFVEIDTAYYSRIYGFVKYIKYTGEEFVLSEESLEMLMARE